jgi:hypothetical protein
LPERLEALDIEHCLLTDLGQVGLYIDQEGWIEVLLRLATQGFFEPSLEYSEVIGGNRHTDSSFMATEAQGEVGASLDRLEEVDLPYASAGTSRLPVDEGEDDGGETVFPHEA